MSDLDEAIKIIKQGGVVIFPTDTAYGIGCRLDDVSAVERVFRIRNRPKEKAVPVLFDSIKRVKEYSLNIENEALVLMKKYWPGALTVVLKVKTKKVPTVVRGGGNTLGFRIPDHQIPVEIIKKIDCPIIGPSANFSGGSTPFTFLDLDKNLRMLVDYIIEEKTNELYESSTVISCVDKPWQILRQGALKLNYGEVNN